LMMNNSGTTMRVKVIGVGCLLGGLATAIMAAPSAAAAPEQCSRGEAANTATSAWASARQYLDNHPGANQVMMAALSQPRGEAAANVRNYFTAHPQEYYDLRGILAPIGDAQRTCNVSVLSPELSSAYNEFMAG
jgi:heme-binding protein